MYESLPRRRVERLIAYARLILAVVSLVAIGLDPTEPVRYAAVAYGLFAFYVVYAAAVLVWVTTTPVVSFQSAVVMHVFDIATFVAFQYFTEGVTSPFFVYFVFSLLCGAMRWDARGVIWTAIPALSAFLGLGIIARHVLRDHGFELNRVIVRTAYLAVTAGLLTYLGAGRQRLGAEISHLAAWPRPASGEPQSALRELLRHAAETLEVPRAVLVWEQTEEPFVHVATFAPGEFRWTHERPGTYGSIVVDALSGQDFLSPDVTVSSPVVLRRGAEQIERHEGAPVDSALVSRFEIRSVLCLLVRGQSVTGRLLALDRPRTTADDLLLGEIVAHEVAATLDQLTLVEQLRHAAALEERIGLARDLHDGVLQSLAGIDLKLGTVRQLLDDPGAARARVDEIQDLVVAEQRDLRALVRTLRSARAEKGEVFDLASALDELRSRIERQWGTRVVIARPPLGAEVSIAYGHDLYFMAHEAIMNAVRHGRASAVEVTVTVEAGDVHLAVVDNGRGFAFQGRHDTASLARLRLGPVSLRERATARGGSLTVESSAAGARIDIVLPITRRGPSDADPADHR